MASIIQGYEYDIFISYRQKDNKHDGWVTGWELEATFKEDISVCVVINPHNGIVQAHDDDASSKRKTESDLIF